MEKFEQASSTQTKGPLVGTLLRTQLTGFPPALIRSQRCSRSQRQ